MNDIMLLPPPARTKARGNHPEVELPPIIEMPSTTLYRPKIRKCANFKRNDVYKLSTTIVRDKMPDVSVNLQTGVNIRPSFDKLALIGFLNLAGIIRTEQDDKIINAHFDPEAIDQYGRRVAKITIIYKKCVENPKT